LTKVGVFLTFSAPFETHKRALTPAKTGASDSHRKDLTTAKIVASDSHRRDLMPVKKATADIKKRALRLLGSELLTPSLLIVERMKFRYTAVWVRVFAEGTDSNDHYIH